MITQFKTPPPPQYQELRLGDQIPFLGHNLRDMDTNIQDGQTPYAINENLDDGGKLTKRKGQMYFLSAAVEAPINGYYKELYYNCHVFHGGTQLYTKDATTGTVTSIKTGLANQQGYFYTFNDILYYKDGVDYLAINSSFTVWSVVNDPSTYIPTIVIGTPPAGGGTSNEDRNIAQKYVKQAFTPDGTATAYTLAYKDLASDTVTASLDSGVTFSKLEGTDFSVDRVTGVVTWNIAPPAVAGVNNTCVIKFAKDFGDSGKVIKAHRSTLYGGGTNDSRIFCCGSLDYKNVYRYTGLTGNTAYDGTYFPEFSFNRIGSDAKYISGWSKIYSKLLALKEDGLYTVAYNNTGTTVTFPVSILNAQIGCDMSDSIQIIQDSPVFGNTTSGLHRIIPTWIESEKNVVPISGLINKPPVNGISKIPGLLEHDYSALQLATSFDDGHKYYICVGNESYVWDYEKSPYTLQTGENGLIWFYYTSVNANNWAFINREIYYGDRTLGQIVKFFDNFNDFGLPIEGVWKSKLYAYEEGSDYLKDVMEIWIGTRAASNSTLEITYFNDNGEQLDSTLVPVSGLTSFDWDNWDWDNFTWDVQQYANEIHLKCKIKKVKYFQIQLRNNVLNENLSILSMVHRYLVSRKVK